MNPHDPESAKRIVAEYAATVERSDDQPLPASVRLLPYPKQTIKAAILTCAAALRDADRLTPDLRQFLEDAYAALADFVDDDIVRVMTEYREALESAASVQPRDRVQTAAWRRVSETSRLAGDIARTIAEDSAALRNEFRTSV